MSRACERSERKWSFLLDKYFSLSFQNQVTHTQITLKYTLYSRHEKVDWNKRDTFLAKRFSHTEVMELFTRRLGRQRKWPEWYFKRTRMTEIVLLLLTNTDRQQPFKILFPQCVASLTLPEYVKLTSHLLRESAKGHPPFLSLSFPCVLCYFPWKSKRDRFSILSFKTDFFKEHFPIVFYSTFHWYWFYVVDVLRCFPSDRLLMFCD